MNRPRRNKKVKAWLKTEYNQQKRRYDKIVKEQEALSPERDKWIEEFLQRIQTRGFNIHADIRRQIQPEEIPRKPRRKFKVVF